MTITTAENTEHPHKSDRASSHHHDLIQDLGKRLDALWRYDRYIAKAEGKARLQECWLTLKQQEQENVRMLKELLKEVKQGSF